MNSLLQDLEYGFRQLRKNPGFACTAILILGLGIGASTAIFSAVNPILFEPLPYPDASRIMMISYVRDDGTRIAHDLPHLSRTGGAEPLLRVLAVMNPWQPTLTGADRPERFDGQQVSAGYFRVLGVSPALGRNFQACGRCAQRPQSRDPQQWLVAASFGGDNDDRRTPGQAR